MNIDIIFKIVAIGILVAVANQVLKYSGKDEIATLTTLAGVIVVLFMIINMISDLFSSIKDIFDLY